MNILVTGAAGFIGYSFIKSILNSDYTIVGLDNINDYYDVELKYTRLSDIGIQKTEDYGNIINSTLYKNVKFVREDICNKEFLIKLFDEFKFDIVINLAAQAGVRDSERLIDSYLESNVIGFVNLLECCKLYNIKRFIYASSSSVYGNCSHLPFSIYDSTEQPISLYACTKKFNELAAYTYSHLHNIQTVGMRFFTVYGPWGRPDMMIYKFVKNIISGSPIDVYNYGDMYRDFTYIDDVCSCIKYLLNNELNFDYNIPYSIYNIGTGCCTGILDVISIIENKLHIKANKNFMNKQTCDVHKTCAETSKPFDNIQFTTCKDGISKFIDWYKWYYKN